MLLNIQLPNTTCIRYRLFGLVILAMIGWSGFALPGAYAVEDTFEWNPLFEGIAYASVEKDAPDPLEVYIVQVDLKTEGIEFFVTPSNGDEPADTNSRATSTFLKEFDLQLAINASPFSPVVNEEGHPMNIVGLSISRGDMYSGPHPDFAALLISKENDITMVTPSYDPSEAWNAVGGFGMLVVDGENVGADDVRHPRTAVGVCADNRFMYMVIIDGRRPNRSVGATLHETAEWMLKVGSYQAINLDGGGSTTLVIEGSGGDPQVLNTPVHGGIPGFERVNGNHLGIYARSLSSKACCN